MKTGRGLAVILVLFLAVTSAAAAVVAQNDKEVKAVAEPILDTVLSGFNNNDYGSYSKYFDDTLKDAIPPKKFSQVRAEILKKLGKYQSRSYMGFQTQGNFTVALWKGRFSASPNDVLIKLVLSKRGDKVLVTGLWFQ